MASQRAFDAADSSEGLDRDHSPRDVPRLPELRQRELEERQGPRRAAGRRHQFGDQRLGVELEAVRPRWRGDRLAQLVGRHRPEEGEATQQLLAEDGERGEAHEEVAARSREQADAAPPLRERGEGERGSARLVRLRDGEELLHLVHENHQRRAIAWTGTYEACDRLRLAREAPLEVSDVGAEWRERRGQRRDRASARDELESCSPALRARARRR